MNRKRFSLVMLMLSMFMFVGCGVQSDGTQARSNHRLFDEIRSLTAARNQLQSDLRALKEEMAALNDMVLQMQSDNDNLYAELQLIRHDRNELKKQLTNRTQERDQHAASLQELRQGIKVLLDRADASLAPVSNSDAKLTSAKVSKPNLE